MSLIFLEHQEEGRFGVVLHLFDKSLVITDVPNGDVTDLEYDITSLKFFLICRSTRCYVGYHNTLTCFGHSKTAALEVPSISYFQPGPDNIRRLVLWAIIIQYES